MTNDDIMKTNVKKLERKYIEVSVVIDRAQYGLLGKRAKDNHLTNDNTKSMLTNANQY